MPHSPFHRRASTRVATVAVTALALAAGVAAPAAAHGGDQRWPSRTTELRLIAFNDLHGQLEPGASSSTGRVTLSDGSTVWAGGAAYLATHVRNLRQEADNSLVLSVGDNIGASPLPSALFHDEPTVAFMNDLGVAASAIGNHELDEGFAELRRIQDGGCHPVDGCQFEDGYEGADFPYLGANMTWEETGRAAVAPYTVRHVKGVPVGIIGLPLRGMDTLVAADGIAGLEFGDEVEAIDRAARQLDRRGVRSIVVLLHQGDNTEGGGPSDCATLPGPARAIAEESSPLVDVFFTGHSHQQYTCTVEDPAGDPRPMVQGASAGRLLSVVDLTIDRRTRDVVREATVAFNHVVTRDVTPDPRAQALVDRAVADSAPISNAPVGTVAESLTRTAAPSGESPLGSVIADAQLAATRGAGAQIAMTNPGGVRTDIDYASSPAQEGDGVVTYGETYAVQPFANILQTITLTGAQLDAVLEQQWQPQPNGTVAQRILQVSANLHYTWSRSAPLGARVSGITVDGVPVAADQTYRVTVNNFLTGGGDGFSELTRGTDLVGGMIDLDALIAYLGANPGLTAPAADRITVTN
ncbi:bifunctional metallophosphatase/5'-nucleotidase [Allostreptomyces psammosilenae]|uniref:5'-nucleotidase n=1 Tax=Allostreptomyces psammosilenae TaxID=1892865 RepID=A0A852ZVX1_9ACTN|nr:bifunctional metallophosphatase/5'-nucleotidase [Allostreptomyces psammosilenae]NYI04924.1 5'-nucleotidase [Allostreptomyces psammosilenae]